MRRRSILIIGIVIVVAINALLFYRRFSQQSGPDGMQQAELNSEERAAELAKKDATAESLIAEWNQGQVTSLASESLPEMVAAMPSDGCLTVTMEAPAISASSLSPPQLSDLNLAITGLLQAYGKNDPSAVTNYMHERGKEFNDRLLPLLKKSLSRRGQTDLEELSDDTIYARMWKAFQLSSHWNGLIAASSCRQIWDGRSLTVEQITNLDENESTNPSSAAAVLYGIFRGSNVVRHHFAPVEGTLDEELGGDEPVLLADVKLIVQFDDDRFNAKAAYLVRFWFNRTAGKWQPISMAGFASHPGTVSLPSLMF